MSTASTTGATATASHSLSRSAGRLDSEEAGAYVGELFAEHGRMVLGLSRLLLRDLVEAEDAAQQVFLSAYLALLRGSLPRDPAPWLAAIARNECRARARARMREPLTLPELPSDLPDPLAAAIRAADLQAVWTALGALPRRQRRALVLRELGGLSYRELGRVLGVSHSAVESLLFRARRQAHTLAAGANARLAALPIALKVAGATMSVGLVATGASDLRPIWVPVVVAHPRDVEQNVIPTPSFHLKPFVAARTVVPPVAHVRQSRHDVEHAGHHPQAAESKAMQGRAEGPLAEPVGQHVERSSEELGPAPPPLEPAQLDVAHDGSGGDSPSEPETGQDGPEGGSGSSGSDDGSGHSGPG